jgi:hypothetical protein
MDSGLALREPRNDGWGATKQPDGQLSKTCQSLRVKIFRFIRNATRFMVCPSHLNEGRFAVVTNVGRDAVDAERATDEGMQGGR